MQFSALYRVALKSAVMVLTLGVLNVQAFDLRDTAGQPQRLADLKQPAA